MMVIVTWLVLLAVILCFNHGAHRHRNSTTVEERLSKLESGSSTEPGEPEEPADEWPEYVQPTGAHDAYHVGDKITYNGKHYTCIYDGCVWTPDAYPQGWQLAE